MKNTADTILLGRGRELTHVPRERWEKDLARAPEHIGRRLDFMSQEHHRVRNFVVRELPRVGGPLSPKEISEGLDLTLARTLEILTDLEERLFFLVRNPGGHVSWAFPVTVESTGHQLRFSTGERLEAA